MANGGVGKRHHLRKMKALKAQEAQAVQVLEMNADNTEDKFSKSFCLLNNLCYNLIGEELPFDIVNILLWEHLYPYLWYVHDDLLQDIELLRPPEHGAEDAFINHIGTAFGPDFTEPNNQVFSVFEHGIIEDVDEQYRKYDEQCNWSMIMILNHIRSFECPFIHLETRLKDPTTEEPRWLCASMGFSEVVFDHEPEIDCYFDMMVLRELTEEDAQEQVASLKMLYSQVTNDTWDSPLEGANFEAIKQYNQNILRKKLWELITEPELEELDPHGYEILDWDAPGRPSKYNRHTYLDWQPQMGEPGRIVFGLVFQDQRGEPGRIVFR